MKSITFILGVIFITGCLLPKRYINNKKEYEIVSFVGQTGVTEDPNDPGIFYASYDTIRVKVKYVYDLTNGYRSGLPKTTYKILNK